MSNSFTAKVYLGNVTVTPNGTQLTFNPDYIDERNKEWAKATPSLSLSMTVKNSIADNLVIGQPFTLTFTPEDNPQD